MVPLRLKQQKSTNDNSKWSTFMYIYYNPNPRRRTTDDCVVRAISKLLGMSWDEAFIRLSFMAYYKKDNLEKNHV